MVRIPLAVVIVLAVDALTKTILPTPEWAVHDRDIRWQLTTLAFLALFGYAMTFRPIAFGAALLFAGTLANLLDSLDGVRNPFVHDFGRGNMAFNFADVALCAGGVALWCSLVLMISQSLRARRFA